MRFTIKAARPWLFAAACFLFLIGCSGEPETVVTPTLSAELQLGANVFTDNCAICHAKSPDTVIRGPTLHGIADRAATRIEGQDARTYLYSSIMRPNDHVVEGFEPIMPETFAKNLSGEELDALVAYLLTFEAEP